MANRASAGVGANTGVLMALRAFLLFLTIVFPFRMAHSAEADLGLPLSLSDAVKHAVDLWRADDDAAALPALARLATSGDRKFVSMMHT